jgi:alkylhydroperoxidase/carboxymuconolactone decarboxylase family protein YurZ
MMKGKPKSAARKSTGVKLPKPPKRYREFTERYPALAQAWELMNQAGAEGPLDARTRRLIRIGVAMGAMREGAVRSGVRKASAEGLAVEEIEQVIALAAGTIGLPSAVACWSWVASALERD